jgi:hypothetical protein
VSRSDQGGGVPIVFFEPGRRAARALQCACPPSPSIFERPILPKMSRKRAAGQRVLKRSLAPPPVRLVFWLGQVNSVKNITDGVGRCWSKTRCAMLVQNSQRTPSPSGRRHLFLMRPGDAFCADSPNIAVSEHSGANSMHGPIRPQKRSPRHFFKVLHIPPERVSGLRICASKPAAVSGFNRD